MNSFVQYLRSAKYQCLWESWALSSAIDSFTVSFHDNNGSSLHAFTAVEGDYRKTSNIRRTLVGNKIVDHSDVAGASPVGAAPTTSSFST